MESRMKTNGIPAIPTPTGQSKPRGSWEQSLPSLKEENQKVKCRSREAFGHTARSRMSPMKQGHMLQVPQPLGARKKKENKDPCRPQGLQKLSQVTRQKYDEQQKKARFQKFPREQQRGGPADQLDSAQRPSIPGNRKMSEPPVKISPGKQTCPGKPALQSFDSSCIPHSTQKEGQNGAVPGVVKSVFRKDGRDTSSEELLHQKLQGISHQQPMTVPKSNAISEQFHKESKTQGRKRKMQPRQQHPINQQNSQKPKLSFWAPGKKAALCPTQPSQNPPKKQRMNPTNAPEKSHARTGSKDTLDTQSPPIANRLGLKGPAETSKKLAAQVPSPDQQQHSRPALDPTIHCVKSHQPSTGRKGGQALRMVFTRLGSNCWVSRLLTDPPPLPLEKKTPPSENPAVPEEGEAARSQAKQPQRPSIPGNRKMSEPPVKLSPGKQTCPGKPALQSFDSSCIPHSTQKEGQNGAVPGVAESVFRKDGRDTSSEEVLDQKLQDISHQQPMAVPKSNAICELFHKESKTQGHKSKMQPSQQHPINQQNSQKPKLSFWAPGKKASLYLTQPSQNPPKKQRMNPTNAPEKSHARTGSKDTLDTQCPPIANRLGIKGAAETTKKLAAQVPSTDQQQHSRPALVPTIPCRVPPAQSTGRNGGQALRMVITRVGSNCWTSRFLTVPPPLPLEKKTPPSENPAVPEEGEAAGSQAKVSVLYEDLWVSSSSEDSGGE